MGAFMRGNFIRGDLRHMERLLYEVVLEVLHVHVRFPLSATTDAFARHAIFFDNRAEIKGSAHRRRGIL